MTDATKNKIIPISVTGLLKQVNSYIWFNKPFCSLVALINILFMLLFKLLEGGISNPYSLLWIISYYFYWCSFFRYYYHQQPYILSKEILGSVSPSAKAMIMMFLVAVMIAVIPMLPAFLGLNEKYTVYTDKYVDILAGFNNGTTLANFKYTLIVYAIFAFISPSLICKPYLSWIASLIGRHLSMKNINTKTTGNYWNFVAISAILLYLQAVIDLLDNVLGLNNWLSYSGNTLLFIYTNLIFAKLYDLFYIKN